MFVIIFKHAETMFCLPLYIYQNRGFRAIDKDLWFEHVGLRDTLIRDTYKPQGYRKPIGFVHMSGEHRLALSENSTISLTGGMTMSWTEEGLEPVGRVTKAGYDRLISYYNEVVRRAQSEEEGVGWVQDDDWSSPPMPQYDFPRQDRRYG